MLLVRVLLISFCVSTLGVAWDSPPTRLPIVFERNSGQAPDGVQFLARSHRGIVFLTRAGISLGADPHPDAALQIRFAHTADIAPVGERPTGGFANYYQAERKHWLEHIPLFEGVRYSNVSPGVDIVVYTSDENLEFDFEVEPGASVEDLVFELKGADKISIAETGELNISAHNRTWRLASPLAYQFLHGKRESVGTSYRILGDGKVAISVGQFSHASKLIVDPVIEYSFVRTYEANFTAMQVDADGNLILAGVSRSTTYPVVNGLPPMAPGFEQAFLTKVNGATKAVMFSTFLPASAGTVLSGMAIDPQGNIYLTGIANSSDFPVTSANLGTCGQFCNTGFVTKFASDGSILYSTLIASGQVISRAIAVDADGNAYITGDAHDGSLQTTPGAYQPTYQGQQCTSCSNAFFAKLNPSGTGYVFASYLPGTGTLPASGIIGTGIALDTTGALYIGGAGIPARLVQPWQSVQGMFFLVKFAPDGRTLQFGTTFGTSSRVFPKMKMGPDGTIYFASSIQSNDYPFTVNAAFHPVVSNDTSQFRDSVVVTAIDPGLKSLKYSTYLGDGFLNDFTVDSRNHVYFAGTNQINTVPLKNAVVSGSPTAGFFGELDDSGNPVILSQFGAHQVSELPGAIATDSTRAIYLAGGVSGMLPPYGADPVLVGPPCDGVPVDKLVDWCSFDGTQGGVFIAKVNDTTGAKLAVTDQYAARLGLFPPFLFIRNAGSADLHISNIALSGGISQEFDTCGRTIAGGASCILSVTDSSGRLAGGTVTITSDAQPSVQSFSLASPGYTPAQPIGDWPVFDDVRFVFPPQLQGTSTPVIPLRIWNIGTQSSKIDLVESHGDVLQTNDCGILAPGNICTIDVSVTPTSSSAINQLGLIYDTNINTASHTGDGGWNQNYYVYSVLAPQSLLLSVQGLSFGHQLVGGTAIPRAVTVTNTTNAVMPTPVASIQGSSQFVIEGNSCTSALPPYGSCAVGVRYVPAGNGDSHGTLAVTAQGASVHADLFATGEIDSVVHLNPLQLDFNSWPVGHSLPNSFQLMNSSSATVSIASITASPSDFTQTNDCGGQMPAGGTCTVQVNFMPTVLGPENGTVTVTLGGGVVQQVLPLTGTGVTPLDISVSSLSFGSVPLGQTVSQLGVGLGNGRPIGPQPYTLSISGDFSVQNTCPNPMPVFVGCTVQISFTPTQVGPRQGTLTVSFPGLSVQGTVALSGIGLGPLVQVASPVDLGQQLVGTTVQHEIVVANGGSTNLTISSYLVAGTNATEFQVPAGQCQTIAPGATCKLKTNFAPSAAGVRTATLTLNDNAADSPQAVTVNGTATATPFTFAVASGSSTATIRAGATATYSLTLSRTPGFSGIVQVTCSDAPAHSNCTVQPGSLDLTSAPSANFTVQISTTGPSAAMRLGNLSIFYLGFVFCPFLAGRRRGRWLLLSLIIYGLFFLVSCGGGGTSAPPPPPSSATPTGTFQVTIKGTSGTSTQSTTLSLVVQ